MLRATALLRAARAQGSFARLHAAAPPSCPVSANGVEADFHAAADATLEALYETIEEHVERLALEGADVALTQGVLTVQLGGERGTFVLNKQAPNKQLWLSSPVSGPWRYDKASGAGWRSVRDGHALHGRLSDELGKLCGLEKLKE